MNGALLSTASGPGSVASPAGFWKESSGGENAEGSCVRGAWRVLGRCFFFETSGQQPFIDSTIVQYK
jgi:hypothetical protein